MKKWSFARISQNNNKHHNRSLRLPGEGGGSKYLFEQVQKMEGKRTNVEIDAVGNKGRKSTCCTVKHLKKSREKDHKSS